MINKMRNIINNLKIKNKLVVTYLIVAITTVSVVGIYLTTRMTDIVINKSISQAENNANTMQYRLEEIIKLTTKVSDMIYGDKDLNSIISRAYDNYGDVVEAYDNYPVVKNYLKYYKEFANITLYVENETLLENSEILKVTNEIREEVWYQDAIKGNGKISWRYTQDKYSKLYHLSLVRSIKDINGKQTAVLVIDISQSALAAITNPDSQNNIIALDRKTISLNEERNIEDEQLSGIKVNESEDGANSVIRTKFNDKDSYIIMNSFKVEKTLANEFQVLIILPVDTITNQTNEVINKSIEVVIITIVLSLIIIIIFSRSISSRIDVLRQEMHRVVNGDFYIVKKIEGNDEIGQLYKDLKIMIESIKKLIDEVYVQKINQQQLKVKQKEVEFAMLSSQINPHFLYNTLETIRMKAYCNEDREVANIVKKLGKIMRRNLEVSGKEVSLASELELIKNYLEIQAMRFEGLVEYELNIEDNINVNEYKILPLLIQPIVENAFIHGLEEKKEKGWIKLSIFNSDECLVIEVSDNGIGIEKEKLIKINSDLDLMYDDNKSIGMKNVNQRIKMYYGNQYGLKIMSELQIRTVVTFKLPIAIRGEI